VFLRLFGCCLSTSTSVERIHIVPEKIDHRLEIADEFLKRLQKQLPILLQTNESKSEMNDPFISHWMLGKELINDLQIPTDQDKIKKSVLLKLVMAADGTVFANFCVKLKTVIDKTKYLKYTFPNIDAFLTSLPMDELIKRISALEEILSPDKEIDFNFYKYLSIKLMKDREQLIEEVLDWLIKHEQPLPPILGGLASVDYDPTISAWLIGQKLAALWGITIDGIKSSQLKIILKQVYENEFHEFYLRICEIKRGAEVSHVRANAMRASQ
jgi:hypothetical protein